MLLHLASLGRAHGDVVRSCLNLQPLLPPTLPFPISKSQVISLGGIEDGGCEGGVGGEASLFPRLRKAYWARFFFFYEHLTPHLGFGPPGPVRSALGGECMVGGEIKIKGTQ